jgi:hypothetical protein
MDREPISGERAASSASPALPASAGDELGLAAAFVDALVARYRPGPPLRIDSALDEFLVRDMTTLPQRRRPRRAFAGAAGAMAAFGALATLGAADALPAAAQSTSTNQGDDGGATSRAHGTPDDENAGGNGHGNAGGRR